jgi:hypothetical protein
MRVAVIVLFFAACGTEREPPPPEPTRPAAPPEPAVPTVAELPPAGAGRASVAYPEWDPTTSRFDHPVRDLPARFARVDTVAHLVLGESAEHGVTVTLYGETIEARQYDVARLTEETAHDPGVVVVSVGEGAQGELRSTGGTLTLEAAGARDLRGTLDVRLQSRNVLHVSEVRARFVAAWDEQLLADLEHREAIREQLRNRR